VPESNGKVGIIGGSYDGFTPLMALVNPHPALKVAVPMNPMVDGWRGDDWFHHGAFRQINLAYILEQVVTRRNDARWFTSHYDDYDISARRFGRRAGAPARRGAERLLAQGGGHPAYDEFWQSQAVDKILARSRSRCRPCWCTACGMPRISTAHRGLQGHQAERQGQQVFLVMGPWNHGGQDGDGSKLGAASAATPACTSARRSCALPRPLSEG
jgi:predicted acyl esterase